MKKLKNNRNNKKKNLRKKRREPKFIRKLSMRQLKEKNFDRRKMKNLF